MKIALNDSTRAKIGELQMEILSVERQLKTSREKLDNLITGILLAKEVSVNCQYDLSTPGELNLIFPEPPPLIEG